MFASSFENSSSKQGISTSITARHPFLILASPYRKCDDKPDSVKNHETRPFCYRRGMRLSGVRILGERQAIEMFIVAYEDERGLGTLFFRNF